MVIPLVIYGSSVLLYWLSRSKTKVSMIERIRKSVTESSANGLTNLSLFMAVIFVFMIVFSSKMTGNFAKDKTGKLDKDKCVDGLTIRYFGEIECMTFLNWGWLLWNQEARLFIFRKCRSGCLSFLTLRSRTCVRVHPTFTAHASPQVRISNILVDKVAGPSYPCSEGERRLQGHYRPPTGMPSVE